MGGENGCGVRREGERLVREAEKLLRRGVEEEEDMNWVRKRMEEVHMSSPERNYGESVRAGGGGGNAMVPGSELSGVRLAEGRRNSEPTSQVEERCLPRSAT